MQELWRAIVEVHNEAKGLFLLAEELEQEDFRDFIQPFNELRHAYEHVIRAKANELGMDGSSPDPDYQRRSLNKTLGHEYRAFFDCADWLSVILRERIQEILLPYSADCITTALPDYYAKFQPRILVITKAIAKVRGDKDISKGRADLGGEVRESTTLLHEVREYKKTLNELQEIHEQIVASIPALQECRARLRREFQKKWGWQVIAGVIGGLVVAAVAFFFGQTFSPKSPTAPKSSGAIQERAR